MAKILCQKPRPAWLVGTGLIAGMFQVLDPFKENIRKDVMFRGIKS
jgi:hypothetical protein